MDGNALLSSQVWSHLHVMLEVWQPAVTVRPSLGAKLYAEKMRQGFSP